MLKPTPPRNQSPLKKLTRSPRTWVAITATANLQPQRRRLDQPVPATANVALSKRKRIPIGLPRLASCLWAVGLRAHTLSKDVPGQVNVALARDAMMAPKNKKAPTAVIPRGTSCRTTLSVPELRQSRICWLYRHLQIRRVRSRNGSGRAPQPPEAEGEPCLG